MTEEQRKKLESRIIDERRELVDSLARFASDNEDGQRRDRSGELTGYRLHMADDGTDVIEQELSASNATHQSEELAVLDAALERLYHHPEDFGRCVVDGRESPYERLEVIPWATTCAEHQLDA